MYKLIIHGLSNQPYMVLRDDGANIPFDPANTDYANFKKEINAKTAQLQDADGNNMTAEEVEVYVASLP
jgi:hypothetical protein